MNAPIENSGNWRDLLGRLGAEFAVVVLGVTIALWADGWVAERSDRAVEAARLGALVDNVSVTLAELRAARDHAAGAADAMRALVSLRQQDQPNDEVDDLLRFAFLYAPAFYPELNVYDDLKNSGELALLTNPGLRSSLATMDARLTLVRDAQTDLATVQTLNIDSYMINHLNLRTFYGSSTGLDDIAEDSRPDLALISDMRFRNLLFLKLDLVTQIEMVFQNAKSALIAVQQSIDSQLR